MRRPRRHALLAALLAGALGTACQDYRFNPAQRCVLQPGSERVSLSSTSSADVLFVVDDSGSMGGEQARLAAAFDSFVNSLHSYNDLRATNRLEPFDFHLAITTTSVFYNRPTSATCQTTCGTSSNVCGASAGGTCTPMRIPKACPTGGGCGGGFSCKATCAGHAGEAVCCDAAGTTIETTNVACTTPGATCGEIQNRYAFNRVPQTCTSSAQCTTAPFDTCTSTSNACGAYPGHLCCAFQPCVTSGDCPGGYACGNSDGRTNVCVANPGGTPLGTPQLSLACEPGVAQEGALYPQGSFVGIGSNPRVLHFDKKLYATDANGDGAWDPVPNRTTATNNQNFTRAQLRDFFASNVRVGTCGSGQEQGLQAARLAVSKALSGQQKDVRTATGAIVAPPGVTADWPHSSGKLVVVYVGDEDDCSSPADPVRGVVLTGSPPADACTADAALPEADQKEFRVTDVVNDLRALGRPLGAGFVVSTAQTTCEDSACTPGVCTDLTCTEAPAVCGGQGPGSRFLEAAELLRAGGADVVSASICDSGFGAILGRIAEIVKPPSALTLPTAPATAALTMLRITNAAGDTRKICRGPALPPLTLAEARAQGYDWWFTASSEQSNDLEKTPSAESRFVYVNHATLQCEPNPGEGYSADYVGVLPAGGCTSHQDCRDALGTTVDWTCYAGINPGPAGACIPPSASARGTCVCSPRSTVCPNG